MEAAFSGDRNTNFLRLASEDRLLASTSVRRGQADGPPAAMRIARMQKEVNPGEHILQHRGRYNQQTPAGESWAWLPHFSSNRPAGLNLTMDVFRGRRSEAPSDCGKFRLSQPHAAKRPAAGGLVEILRNFPHRGTLAFPHFPAYVCGRNQTENGSPTSRMRAVASRSMYGRSPEAARAFR